MQLYAVLFFTFLKLLLVNATSLEALQMINSVSAEESKICFKIC